MQRFLILLLFNFYFVFPSSFNYLTGWLHIISGKETAAHRFFPLFGGYYSSFSG
jgi:hypothetical protein